ncbi:MAG: response regulator [Minisyncoccota bacterium]
MAPKSKLLFVDDDIETRMLYSDALRAVNFDVREGSDGVEGLKLVSEETPDIIVTGIIMPNMDGFGFVEALRKNTATAHIPVIFLSHLGREEDKERAMTFGASDFLIRDMTTPNSMITHINILLTQKTYILGIDTFNFDATQFAKDFNIDPDFVCSKEKSGKEGEGRIALKLRKQNETDHTFSADIVCV